VGTVSPVEGRWWMRSDFDAADTAAAWMRLARKHMPEALSDRPDLSWPTAGRK